MALFGKLTNPSKDVLKEIAAARKLGMDYVEIGIEGPLSTSFQLGARSAEISSALKRNRLFALGHMAWWAELGAASEDVRVGWLGEVKHAIDVCESVGIRQLTVHSHARGMYARSGDFLREVMDNYVQSLKELSEYGNDRGVKIVLENAADRGEITRFDDFKYIVSRVKEIGVHIDVGHAFINGGMDSVEKFITSFKGRVSHFHMHDNHGAEDEHLPVGAGVIDWSVVTGLLKKIKYDRTITLEVFTQDESYVRISADKLRALMK